MPGIPLDINTLVIEDKNELVGHLIISGYNNLEVFEITDNALQNILSLTIENNPKLKSIIIGDNSCTYTMNITLSSKIYLIQLI